MKPAMVNNAKQTQSEDTGIIYTGFMSVIFCGKDPPFFFQGQQDENWYHVPHPDLSKTSEKLSLLREGVATYRWPFSVCKISAFL